MPQLNRDLLREVFYEVVKEDGNFKNIDNFMMAGKEPVKVVLDICKKANVVVIFKERVVAKFPEIVYEPENDDDDIDEGNV